MTEEEYIKSFWESAEAHEVGFPADPNEDAVVGNDGLTDLERQLLAEQYCREHNWNDVPERNPNE